MTKNILIFGALLSLFSSCKNVSNKGLEANQNKEISWSFDTITQLVYNRDSKLDVIDFDQKNDTIAVYRSYYSCEYYVNIIRAHRAEIGNQVIAVKSYYKDFSSGKITHSNGSSENFYELINENGKSSNEYNLSSQCFLFASLPTKIKTIGNKETIDFSEAIFSSLGIIVYTLDSISSKNLAFIKGEFSLKDSPKLNLLDGYEYTGKGTVQKIFNLNSKRIQSVVEINHGHLIYNDSAENRHRNAHYISSNKYELIGENKYNGKSKIDNPDFIIGQ